MLPRFLKLVIVMVIFTAAAGISTYLTIHTLIRSEDTVVIPDLTGKEVVYALELLSDLGMNTKVKGSDYSNSVPRHHVISQDPEPGSEIKKGRDIRLIISKGARAVIIPNLSGNNLPRVRIYLEENGLRQGMLTYIHHSQRPKEEVLAQYPQPGVQALRGNSVDLLISAGHGNNLMIMPNLTGMGLDQAIEAIEDGHLVVGTIRTINNPKVSIDRIVDHSPAGGYPVAVGSEINLTINRIQRADKGSRAQYTAFFSHRVEPGFLKTHFRVRINRPESSIDLFNDFVKPGSMFWLLIPRDQPATLFLYADDELIKTMHYD